MTKTQATAIQKIKKYIEQNDMHNNSDYEFKEFNVKETNYGTVIVYSVTGLKNDEGTMAAVLCRNTRHIFIGRRGGLRSSKWDTIKKKTVNLKGWSDVMTYGCKH
ncbi:hypothetical protein [Anaerotignum sp.]|uniref:hypothetical protein n=1 Tax=Anaerotignum sp. TaxID=2039241 RepID=UPI0028ABF29D|nr:hypothetical protein [Anaerotignum sp.]